MKKTIAIILSLMMAFPVTVYADPPPTTTEETQPDTNEETEAPPTVLRLRPRIMGIKQGEVAPYTGVLLNTLAAAKVFTEKSYSDEECKLRIAYEVEREIARVNLLLQSTRVSMESMEKRYVSIISIKDTEIQRLSDIASNKADYSVWWATGGVIVGIGLTLAVVYGVKSMQND